VQDYEISVGLAVHSGLARILTVWYGAEGETRCTIGCEYLFGCQVLRRGFGVQELIRSQAVSQDAVSADLASAFSEDHERRIVGVIPIRDVNLDRIESQTRAGSFRVHGARAEDQAVRTRGPEKREKKASPNLFHDTPPLAAPLRFPPSLTTAETARQIRSGDL
jgi:hypothetical protein